MMDATTRCSACGSSEARSFLDVRDVPVECNLLLDSEEEARAVPRGDIALALCRRCGLIWNTRFDPSLLRYDTRYENSLWSSPHFAAYGRELAQRLVDRYGIRGKTVVEIGSGRGEFLSLLCRLGNNRGLGIDPAYDASEDAPDGRIRMIAEEFSDRDPLQADLVVCRHVVEHLAEPRAFLDMVRRAIGRRTTTAVYFEVPDTMSVFRDGSVWDLIYEHCSYFTEPSLKWLFRAAAFDIKELSAAFGGQFLGIEAFPGESHDEVAPGVADLEASVRDFERTYRTVVEGWTDRLVDWEKRGLHVAVWGAGSKGVTFLNTVPGAASIQAVVDINPRKQGHHVAGTGQPVVGPEGLRKLTPDVVLVMNPLYRAEITEMLQGVGVPADVVSIASLAA
jgi:C-methyltransferase C-terminal domain/Methyltransferase domain